MSHVMKVLTLMVFAFKLQASSLSEEYLDIQGKSFSFSLLTELTPKVKDEIKNTMILSFLEAYKLYTKEDLKIKFSSKEEWLKVTFEEEIQDIQEQKTTINVFIISDNSKVVAAATIETEKNISNCLYVRKLAVHPDYKGKGIGRKMMEKIEEYNPNIHLIVLMTRVMNQNSKKFYEALGFKTGDYHHSDYSRETHVGYRKDIEK